MPVNCRINIDGTVLAPNGKESKLFKNLSDKFGREKALELYYLTDSLEYKDSLFLDVDTNGEMLVNNFLKFALSSETTEDFSKETIDLQHKVSPENIVNLKRLYVEGIFSPTYDNLKRTNVFTEDEIYEIVYSQDKQQNLKRFIDQLDTVDGISQIDNFRVSKEEYNKIGMSPLENPNKVKEEVMNILAQGNNIVEVESLVNTLPYQEIIDRYNNDFVFRQLITEEAINSDFVKIETDDNAILDTIVNTLDVANLDEVVNATDRILAFTDKNLILEEFDSLQDSLIDVGIELEISEYDLSTKSIDEIKSFVQVVNDFATNMNFDTSTALANSIDNFIEKPINKVVSNVKSIDTRVSTLRYLDTKENEITNFEEKSLIKHNDNVYQKVKDSYTTDQLYNALYQRVIQRPSLLPVSALPSVSDGIFLDIEKLQDPVNREFVLEDIENYVSSQLDTLPEGSTETKEKILIYKLSYGAPVIKPQNNFVANPVDNESYLRDEYISDFNKKRLNNKKNNTDIYKAFYSFFKVDSKGIRPIDNSVYTEDNIRNGINLLPINEKEDLKNYATISKHFGMQFNNYISDIVSEARLKAQQDPYSLPKLKNNYQRVDTDEIITTSQDNQFIRLDDKPYEKVLEYNGVSLYKQLPIGTDIFRPTEINKPKTDKSIEFLKEYEVVNNDKIVNKKHLSKEALNNLNQQKFDCQ